MLSQDGKGVLLGGRDRTDWSQGIGDDPHRFVIEDFMMLIIRVFRKKGKDIVIMLVKHQF